MWKNVGQFLNRFKNIKLSESFIRKESAEIISAILKTKIEDNQIEERNGTLYLKTQNPAMRNEIFLKKNEILKSLNSRLGPKAPKDIR